MDVDRAERRQVQNRLRQQQAVCGNDEHAGVRFTKPLERFLRLEGLRLEQGEPALRREALDGARHGPHAAASGAVGLRQDQDHFVARVDQPRERPLGEFRRAGENEAQESGALR